MSLHLFSLPLKTSTLLMALHYVCFPPTANTDGLPPQSRKDSRLLGIGARGWRTLLKKEKASAETALSGLHFLPPARRRRSP